MELRKDSVCLRYGCEERWAECRDIGRGWPGMQGLGPFGSNPSPSSTPFTSRPSMSAPGPTALVLNLGADFKKI